MSALPDGPMLRLAGEAPEPFARIIERSAGTAARLESELGLAPGDRIVLALESSRVHVELVAAAWRLGLQLIAVPPSASALGFAGILEAAAPQAAAIDAGNERLGRALRDWAGTLRPLGEAPGARDIVLGTGLPQPRGARPARPDSRGRDWQDWLQHLPPAVFYTSGSTSTAKGAILRWPRILEKGKAVLGFYGASGADRVMPILPLSHVYGLYCLMGAVALGADCIVHRESSSPAALAAGLADHAASVAICPPIVGAFLFGRRGCEPAVRERRRVLSMGGAATSREQAARILAALPRTRVFLSYGLAETYSTVACNEASLPGADPGAVGPMRFGAFAEVRDPADGAALAAGEIGELCIGGWSVMDGYLGREGEGFTADGLFRTGDLARLDHQGAISITGRLKEMINAGGLSIFPSEIEQAIGQHPAVADCGVFGERAGDLEVVCAAVVLHPAAAARPREEMLDELLEHCRGHLASKMVPRRLTVVPAIPRGALGKIARAELRRLCAPAQAPSAQVEAQAEGPDLARV